MGHHWRRRRAQRFLWPLLTQLVPATSSRSCAWFPSIFRWVCLMRLRARESHHGGRTAELFVKHVPPATCGEAWRWERGSRMSVVPVPLLMMEEDHFSCA